MNIFSITLRVDDEDEVWNELTELYNEDFDFIFYSFSLDNSVAVSTKFNSVLANLRVNKSRRCYYRYE